MTAAPALPALTDMDFAARVAAAAGVLVLFTARWCAPSVRMLADTPALADAVRRQLLAGLYRADIDAAPVAAAAAEVRAVPCLVLYRAGRPVAQLPGQWPAARVAEWLNDSMKSEG